MIPGPRPKNYEKRNKGKMIDGALIKQEIESGINLEGCSSRFVGFVNNTQANQFVASGHLFTEDAQVDNLISHGKFSHRLQMEVIRQAEKVGKISLTLENGQELSHKDLLAVMAGTDPLLWNMTIDAVTSHMSGSAEDRFKPKNHTFECTSPTNINSLIMCFGGNIGLPNLQHVMLDSHWKEADQFIERLRESDTKKLSSIPDREIYIASMSLFARRMDEQVVERSFLTSSPNDSLQEGLKSGKYQQFPKAGNGIVVKSPKGKSFTNNNQELQ